MENNVKHFLELKKGKETVYVTQIFGDGFVPDEKFYKGLGLDIDMDNPELAPKRVNLKKLVVEWWKFLKRNLNEKTFINDKRFIYDMDEDAEKLYYHLMYHNKLKISQFFLVINDLEKYTDNTDVGKLAKDYNLYLSIYN